MKPFSSSVTSLNQLVRLQSYEKAMGWCTAQYKMQLFCMKTNVKESQNFELAHLQKKKILAVWQLLVSELS